MLSGFWIKQTFWLKNTLSNTILIFQIISVSSRKGNTNLRPLTFCVISNFLIPKINLYKIKKTIFQHCYVGKYLCFRGEGRRDWEAVLRYGVWMNHMITLESIECIFLTYIITLYIYLDLNPWIKYDFKSQGIMYFLSTWSISFSTFILNPPVLYT